MAKVQYFNPGFQAPLFKNDVEMFLKAGADAMYDSNCTSVQGKYLSKFITIDTQKEFGFPADVIINTAQALKNGGFPGAELFLTDPIDYSQIYTKHDLIAKIAENAGYAFGMVRDIKTKEGYQWAGVCFFDEERNGDTYVLHTYLEMVIQFQKLHPEMLVLWYGYPNSTVWTKPDRYHTSIKEADYQAYINEPLFHYPRFYNEPGKRYFDGGNGYCKSPLPREESLYVKNGTNYVLKDGKRQFRRDTFSEYQFGIRNEWVSEPIDYMDRFKLVGKDGKTVSDIHYAVAHEYGNMIWCKITMSQLAKHETGTHDTSRWRDYNARPIATISLLTEFGTAGANHDRRRWISKGQIIFRILSIYFKGYYGVEIWETGLSSEQHYNPDFPYSKGNKPLPQQGEKRAPHWWYADAVWGDESLKDDNYSRYKWAFKALNVMNEVFTHYEYNENLRYLDFTHNTDSFERKEVIILGMYQGSNCHILAYYPYHDVQDSTPIDLNVGGQEYSFNVDGRMPTVVHLEGFFGDFEPYDFNVSYNNIDGKGYLLNGQQR